jgi:hypothetical protein
MVSDRINRSQDSVDNFTKIRKCSTCGNFTSSKEKTKWGLYEHWYGSSENPICKKCYVRKHYRKKFSPFGVNCDNCNGIKTTLTKYGVPK